MTTMAGSRLPAHHDVNDVLVGRVSRRAATIPSGGPFAEDTGMGPMAGERRSATVLGFVDSARAEGARVGAGDRQPPLGGLVVEPAGTRSVWLELSGTVGDPFLLG